MRVLTLILLVSFFSSDLKSQKNWVDGQLLIQLSGEINPDKWLADCNQCELLEEVVPAFNIYLVRLNDSNVDLNDMIRLMNTDRNILHVQKNHIGSTREVFPDDPFFVNQWNFFNDGSSGGTEDADVDMELAWELSTGGWTADGDTIVVAVVDDGFFLSHNDLRFRINHDEIPDNGIDDDENGYIDDYGGWNAAEGNDNIPNGSHGTHITGIIGAKGDNFLGVTGINWYTEVLAVSIGLGPVIESNVLAAYGYVWNERKLYDDTNGEEGSFIVSTNASFGIDYGMPDDFPLWCSMYDSLGQLGILNSAATANLNINVDVAGDMPTTCASNFLITTNNTNKEDNKSSSAYGAINIDMGAPGALVYSTVIDNAYAYQSGTSMAAPHIAGAVALLFSYACPAFISQYKADPETYSQHIKDFIMEGVDPLESLDTITVSGGRLNVYNAMLLLDEFCVNLPSEISEEATVNPIIYPNPVSEALFVSRLEAQQEYLFSFADMRGSKSFQGVIPASTQSTRVIPVQQLQSGVYVLSVRTSTGKAVISELIVVE